MEVIRTIITVILIAVLGFGAIFIRLAFDKEFTGERAEHLLFEGMVLLVLTLCALKYFMSDEE